MTAFLRACRKQPTDFTPIWLMRQAGRYQPEYRALRAKHSFIELCKNPDLATEISLLPVQQLGVDAAIVFADILLVLEPLGIGFEFAKDDGPRIHHPLRTPADVDAVAERIVPDESLGYVMRTIRQVRASLPAHVPLIGFAGAPFTLASYVIEGGGSRHYLHTKRMMYADPGAWNALMHKLTDAIADYLRAQVRAGAQALQVFDSWVGCLSSGDYASYVAPHMRRLFAALADDAAAADVPVIHFGTGNPALYPAIRAAGGHVVGLDWRVPLDEAWAQLGDVAVMGNLDPALLVAPRPVMLDQAREILRRAGGRAGHIFNLGHGVYPDAQVDQVRALVDFVHEESAR